MYKLREMNPSLLRWVTALTIVVMFGAVSASAKSPVVDSTQSALENEIGTATSVGTQAINTSKIAPFGTRAARIAQSSQYLAVVYQYGSTIRLRSTKKEGDGAWIIFPPVLGSGSAPGLVFSNDTTVHVVWVSTNQRQILYVSCTLAVSQLRYPGCDHQQRQPNRRSAGDYLSVGDSLRGLDQFQSWPGDRGSLSHQRFQLAV